MVEANLVEPKTSPKINLQLAPFKSLSLGIPPKLQVQLALLSLSFGLPPKIAVGCRWVQGPQGPHRLQAAGSSAGLRGAGQANCREAHVAAHLEDTFGPSRPPQRGFGDSGNRKKKGGSRRAAQLG